MTNIAKCTEIKQLLSEQKLDVLSLNELNLGSDVDSRTLDVPSSYDFIRRDRPNSNRGGCGIMISKKLAYSSVNLKVDDIENIEANWIRLSSINLYICSFYRSNNYCNLDVFLDYMGSCMSKLNGKKVMWIGDINVDQNNINHSMYKKLDVTLKAYNLVQTVQGITRYNQQTDKITQTTLDVIFTNCHSDFIDSQVLDTRIGDHQAIKCQLNFKVQQPAKYKKFVIKDHSRANVDLFVEHLEVHNEYISDILNSNDVGYAACRLENHISDCYDQFFHNKIITVHEKYVHSPSKELLTAIKDKGKLYTVFKKLLNKVENKIPSCNRCKKCTLCFNCDQAWNVYKVQRNKVTTLSRANKRENVIADLKTKSARNDLKGIWKTIKHTSNMAPTGNPQCSEFLKLDPNELNRHFVNIGKDIQSNIPQHTGVTYKDFLTSRTTETMLSEFCTVSPEEVNEYIKQISCNKSTFDNTPVKIFKSILPIIVEPLTHIVNLSLVNGILPEICKKACVTPIHKNGDKLDTNNYRPISILSIMGKCIEYFVSKQLTKYMETNDIFCDNQYGFRKNHSTTFLMLDIFDEIYTSKTSGQKPAIIFLDIKKAFDTVDHDILIDKLRYYGITGVVLNWFKSFLANRYQCTKVGKNKSSFLLILCGVPQGSILGPILFSIYINDLASICKMSIPYLFADDGALLFKDIDRNTYMNMQIELLIVKKWLDLNKLSLNIEKTQYLVFDNVSENEFILVNDILIYECKQTKYLGLIVDNKLSFAGHIEYMKKKIVKRINAMYKSKSFLPLHYRKMFANALVLPVFDYLDIIYNKACKSRLLDLDILYKKVAKIALDLPQRESSIKVYKEMAWLPLHLRRQLHLSTYMCRVMIDIGPPKIRNKFTYITGNNRSANNSNLFINRSKCNKEFYYLGAKAWNSVPLHIRENTSDPKDFSNKYKNILLESLVNNQEYEVNNSFDFMYTTPS